jgi:hypothetical protein
VDRKETTIEGVRTVHPAELIHAETTYTVPTWEPLGLLSLKVEMTITPLRDLEPDEAAVQILEFLGREAGSFAQVTTAGTDGYLSTKALLPGDAVHGRHEGHWFLVHPDPLGAVLLVPLDDGTFLLTAEPSSKGPRVRLAVPLPGEGWRRGQSLRVRFMLALTSGTEADPVSLAREATSLWRGETAGIRVMHGSVDEVAGTVRLLPGPAGWLEADVGPAGRPVPQVLEIDGQSSRVPVYANGFDSRVLSSWIPLAVSGGVAYRSVPTDARGTFRAGRLIHCSNDALQIDVKALRSDAIEVWVHNPTASEQHALLSPSGLIPCRSDAVEDVWAPGAERLVTFIRR